MATFSPEAWKYKQDWKDLRRKPLGEILQMKFHAPSPSQQPQGNPEGPRGGLPHYEVVDRLFDSLSGYLIYFHAAQFCCQL